MTRERDIENLLRREVHRLGGLCWKFESPGTSGVPDRVVVLPSGRLIWIELKRPGQSPRPQQLKRITELAARGQEAVWIDQLDGVYEVLK